MNFQLSIYIIFCWGLSSLTAKAQGYAFGFKGGGTVGIQQWNYFKQDPLFIYHGNLFIESVAEGSPFSVFAQTGYNPKGSAMRFRRPILVGSQEYKVPTRKFIFHNLSLAFGGKNRFRQRESSNLYYILGVRGEYTFGTNLDEFEYVNQFYPIYPLDFYVKKFNYGIIAGGGIELLFSELVGGIIEFTFLPDFSRQYYQPLIPNVIDPYRVGQTVDIQERRIINIAIELSIGLRFLNKFVYVD